MTDQPTPVSTPAPAAALAVGARHVIWLSGEGEIEELSFTDAARRLGDGASLVVCHKASIAARLKIEDFAALDVLELFAFVRPAQFCLPTARGLAQALGVPLPGTLEKEAESLFAAADVLLDELGDFEGKMRGDALAVAFAMAPTWGWSAAGLESLGSSDTPHSHTKYSGLRVWERLKEWEESPPPPSPGHEPVTEAQAREKLSHLLGAGSEKRPQQADYASHAIEAFAPRNHEDQPRMALAEAGTGVGKTLGYIAPASVWADINKGSVWISTFTRNLQRQLDGELDRLYPDSKEKAKNVVVRKGRENYFCLLNFEEAVNRLSGGAMGHEDSIALGLVARWVLASRDGDMAGGDFPAWLSGLLGRGLTVDLTDTRGECVYSACNHYRKCFVERSVRRARNASLVVANHALVMIQAALGSLGEDQLPARYVFDEGHHIFGAADSAFSTQLTGNETAELRRWILGAEDAKKSRSRGLLTRIGDLVMGDDAAAKALDDVLRAAHALPAPAWRQRLAREQPRGPAEAFLLLVRQQVYARDPDKDSPHSLETTCQSPVPGLLEAAKELATALNEMAKPLSVLGKALGTVLDAESVDLDSASRLRIEAVRRGLERRAKKNVEAWRAMLEDLEQETPPQFVDWFGVERISGQDFDIGMHRHWVDPTLPFAKVVCQPAQGVLITSATLRDGEQWNSARARTGVDHLESEAILTATPSPFDYAGQTRVLVVGDVSKNNPQAVAAAYRELFLASGGGALGLFTAITRLRDVHRRIAGKLEDAGIQLLAQHVSDMDTGTLIDIFRAEANSCLLGSDAVRDGVDIPGRSLRLIVFDRTPWPRPDILHKARRKAFQEGRGYDDMLTRLKIKQAYGRLLRRATDKGVFVMLDRAFPTRLTTAFPEGVEAQRIGLAEAIEEIRTFLKD